MPAFLYGLGDRQSEQGPSSECTDPVSSLFHGNLVGIQSTPIVEGRLYRIPYGTKDNPIFNCR